MTHRTASITRFLRKASLAAAALLTAAGCGGDDGASPPSGDGGGAPNEARCAAEQVVGPSGACMPVGIQGCAELFREEDGLCHPRRDKCPDGTIPRFGEGCVEVGIQRSKCADVFVDPDGLCHPTMARCDDRPGTFAVPNEGCVPIDGPDGCGTGAWGNIADAPNTVYVDPSAPAGGDGSKGAPVSTIADAMGRLVDGGRIALAAGSYGEQVVIEKPIELVGRCPSMTRLDGPTVDVPGSSGVRVRRAKGVTIRGVAIGGWHSGIVAESGASVRVDRVHLRGLVDTAVLAIDTGTEVSLVHTLIGHAASDGGGVRTLHGVYAEAGARVSVESSALFGLVLLGLQSARSAAELTVGSTLIEGTANDTSPDAVAVIVDEDSTATLHDSAVVGTAGFGVLASDPGATASVVGSYLGDNRVPPGRPGQGAATLVQYGAALSLAGNALVDNDHAAVLAIDPGSTATSRGDLIARTRPTLPDGNDASLVVASGAKLSVDSSALLENGELGALVTREGAELALTGTLVEGTLADESDGHFGNGLVASEGALLSVDGSALVGNRYIALLGTDEVRVAVRGSLVEGTLPDKSDGLSGRGISMQLASEFLLESSVIAGNREVSVLMQDVQDTSVRGSLIQHTLVEEGSGAFGAGFVAATAAPEARVSLADTVLRDNRVTGALIVGTTAEISRVWVDGVAAGQYYLISPPRSLDGVGDGILAVEHANVTVADCRVEGAARAGVLFDKSSGSVDRTVATRNGFGAVLQGSPRPTLGEGNTISKNTLQDIDIDGELPVPDDEPMLP